MFRLAVVHSPVGPQKGPGLDEDIQSPGLERDHLYEGPRRYDYWDPYGGQGPDHFDETNVKPPKKKKYERKPEVAGKKVAFDFDGTITAAPRAFRRIVDAVNGWGGESYLVTGRPDMERKAVEDFVGLYGMRFTGKHFYPIPYRFDWVAWDTLLDVRIGNWKAGVLERLGVDIAIDDNEIHIAQIVRRLPDILVLKPIGG